MRSCRCKTVHTKVWLGEINACFPLFFSSFLKMRSRCLWRQYMRHWRKHRRWRWHPLPCLPSAVAFFATQLTRPLTPSCKPLESSSEEVGKVALWKLWCWSMWLTRLCLVSCWLPSSCLASVFRWRINPVHQLLGAGVEMLTGGLSSTQREAWVHNLFCLSFIWTVSHMSVSCVLADSRYASAGFCALI